MLERVATAKDALFKTGEIRRQRRLPPVEEQKRIVAKIDSVASAVRDLAERLESAEAVRQRLLSAILTQEVL